MFLVGRVVKYIGRTFNSVHLLFILSIDSLIEAWRDKASGVFCQYMKKNPNIIQVVVYLGVYMKIKRSPSCAGLRRLIVI